MDSIDKWTVFIAWLWMTTGIAEIIFNKLAPLWVAYPATVIYVLVAMAIMFDLWVKMKSFERAPIKGETQ